jgi:hypothetical protein
MEELKDLTMEDLNTLAKISKTYKKLYYDSFGVCGISAEYIQLTAMTFFDLFKEDFAIKERYSFDYPYEIKKIFKGIEFCCLISYKDAEEIKNEFSIDLMKKIKELKKEGVIND